MSSVNASISLVEAWTAWLRGELDPSAELLGLTVRWWGRIGKIALFAGSATVILDIIGPDRLRVWAYRNKQQETRAVWTLKVILVYGAMLWIFLVPLADLSWPKWVKVILAIPAILAARVFFGLTYTLLIGALISTLTSSRPAQALRLVAAIFLVVGFHFDLLAS